MNKLEIAGLYKNVGLDTSNEVVERQLNAAVGIFPSMTLQNAESLVLVLFCNDADRETIGWLVEASQAYNPGLGSSGIDRDVEILCSILLRHAISGAASYSDLVCLTVEAAAFGGKRQSKVDVDLVSYAQQQILSQQLSDLSLRHLEEDEQSDFEELLDEAEGPITANTLPQAWPPLKEIFDDLRSSTEAISSSHVEKINDVIDKVNRIEEQIQTQWFAISKWSTTANKPFAALSLGEAIARAAFELSTIVKSSVGPAAAPALLNMAVADLFTKAKSKEVQFSDVCTASPLLWRKSWLKLDQKNPRMKLVPTLSAFSMATEANDELDWQARFKRELGVDPVFTIRPLDLTLQLFHEILVLRSKD